MTSTRLLIVFVVSCALLCRPARLLAATPRGSITIDRIADIKNLHYTGNTGMWMGLDPTDAPLFLRNLGTRDVYALSLEEK